MKPYLLVLENFQSLRERTEIPISPLTFLYGPNSAGKSCIHDALSLINNVISGGSLARVHSPVSRWLHINPLIDLKSNSKRPELSIDLHFKTGYFDAAIHKGRFDIQDIFEISGGIYNWFDEAGWEFVLSLRGEPDGLSVIALAAGGLNIFSINLDLTHGPDKLTITKKPFGNTLTSLIQKHANPLKKQDKHYKLDCLVNFAKPISISASGGESEFERDLVEIVNILLSDLAEHISVPFNLGADRTTIENSALSHICSNQIFPEGISGLPSNFAEAPIFNLGFPIDSKFDFMNSLAKSSYVELFKEKNEIFIDNQTTDRLPEQTLDPVLSAAAKLGFAMGARGRGPRRSINEPIHGFVNRCLREHLFIDHGYQLVFEALEIRPATNLSVPPLSAALMIGSLVDKTGRRMTFEDVGTGISCVIPVLVAIHSGNGFFQQPELHLHPALQSALGDTFAEATKVEHAHHFIETHSEYIMLRCLRRIRETTAGKHPDGSPLALKPEDLSVLYFEPQPDGCSKVKNIRVSTQGDFIDRWPRGFFEERGKDLFDE